MERKIVPYLDKDFQYGMHACGFMYDIMFTNSLEAMEYWYKQGIKIFEVDIDVTNDGEYVACHNFTKETFKKMEIQNIPDICTCSWFKEQKLYGKTTEGLTPISLEDIFELLCKYSDTLFMIDPKIYSYNGICELLDKIKSYIDKFGIDGKRIIFETYNEDMIFATREYKGLVQYQYCVDDEIQMGTSEKIRSWEIDVLVDFLKKNDIWILSYPWKFAVEDLERVKRLHDEGFVMFSKTRNDILADFLKKACVDVNIIDYLVTPEQEEELQGYKKEYLQMYGDKIKSTFKGVKE